MTDIMALPTALDPRLKEIIRDAYTSTLQEIGEYEYVYIENKIDSKLGVVAHSSISWLIRLSKYYSVLYQILRRNHPTTSTISASSVRAIAAALFYFINPYDIISDLTPETGYVDDYYIFVLCLESLEPPDKERIMEQLLDFREEEGFAEQESAKGLV